MQSTTTILHTRSRRHEWQGVGPLSIKTFRGGQASYSVAGGRHLVDDSCYLVLNEGQEYAIRVDALTPVESFCLFFAPGFAESVYYSVTTPSDRLLDEPTPPAPMPVAFYERTYPHDGALSHALFRLRRASTHGACDAGWVEEQLQGIMQALLESRQQIQAEVALLPYLRVATREEIYRRLYRARDYMVAQLDQPLTLAELAQQACLSPNHFLRTFKQVFQQTPHHYLTHQRLQRAAYLLCKSDLPVTDICLAVGFESLGSFSWRFRQHFGLAPAHYRSAKRSRPVKR